MVAVHKPFGENQEINLNFIVVTNPLKPLESRQLYSRDFEDKPLAEQIGVLHGDWVVFLNSEEIQQEELRKVTPKPGDIVVMAPVLSGGDDGKNILRIILVIVLIVVTQGIASGAIGGLSGTTAIAASSAVMIGGTLLINAVLPPILPDFDGGQSSAADKATYGSDGPKNTSIDGLVIPVIYGTHWQAGNIIALFTENKDSRNQYLNMLLVASEGEVDSISDFEINEQPLSNFNNVDIQTRLGTPVQEQLPYFGSTVIPNSIGIEFPAGGPYNYYTTTAAADKIRFDLVYDQGLVDYTSGNAKEAESIIQIEFKVAGTADPFVSFLSSTGIYYRRYSRTVTRGGEEYEAYANGQDGLHVNGKNSTPVRYSVYSGTLDPLLRYEIRYRSVSSYLDSAIRRHVVVTDINEIQYTDVTYRDTALVGMRVRLSDQLNGIPQLRYKVRGVKVKTYNEATDSWNAKEYSHNPAWVAYDLLTNERYGGGIAESVLEPVLSYWREWAIFCDANGLAYNGVLSSKQSLWDSMVAIFRIGRAQIVRRGTRYLPAIERAQAPVQMYTMGSIKEKSLNVSWLSLDAAANEVMINFFDEEDYNKKKPIIVQDQAALARGDEVRATEMTLYGVTNRDQASKEGTFALNMNAIQQTIIFEVPVESIAASIGEVIALQHDMPQWGFGGRTVAGSTDTVINLDKPVSMFNGNTYTLMLTFDSVLRLSSTISSITSNRVVIAGFEPSTTPVKRLIKTANGSDYAITGTFDGGAGNKGVILESTTGLLTSDAVNLFDTDVIETRAVVIEFGDYSTITVATPFSNAPSDLSSYAFGETNSVVKNFTIRGISGSQSMWRTINATEYNASVYDDTPAIVLDALTPIPAPISVVDSVTFAEYGRQIGNSFRSLLSVYIDSTAESYQYSEVWLQREGEEYLRVSSSSITQFELEVEDGEILNFRIVPVDNLGRKPILETTPVYTHTVTGSLPLSPHYPINVTAVALSSSAIRISWDPADQAGVTRTDRGGLFEVWHYEGVTSDFANATFLNNSGADFYQHDGLFPVSSHTYWVIEVDRVHQTVKSVNSAAAVGSTSASVRNLVTRLKLNYSDYVTPANGKVYIHGETGGLAADVNGSIETSDTPFTLTLPKDVIHTFSSSVSGYIVYDSANTGAFNTRNYALAFKNGAAWFYDDGVSAVVSFVSNANIWVIGELTLGAGNVVANGRLWSTARYADGLADVASTSNQVYVSNVQPADGSQGDIWIEPLTGVTRIWNGAAWVLASDVTGLNTALDVQNVNGVPAADVQSQASTAATTVVTHTNQIGDLEGDVSTIAGTQSTLSTTVGEHTTSITTTTESIDGIKAKWGVVIDVNGKVAGVQLIGSEDAPAQFIIDANASISGDLIVAGQVKADYISIDGLTLDTDGLGNLIVKSDGVGSDQLATSFQSTNYVANSTGWRIQKNGNAEFNGVVISRPLMVDSGQISIGSPSWARFTSITQVMTGFIITNTPFSSWGGTNKSYIVAIGTGGTWYAEEPDVLAFPQDLLWGVTGEIFPLTQWSGSPLVRIEYKVWVQYMKGATNGVLNWKLYEVT